MKIALKLQYVDLFSSKTRVRTNAIYRNHLSCFSLTFTHLQYEYEVYGYTSVNRCGERSSFFDNKLTRRTVYKSTHSIFLRIIYNILMKHVLNLVSGNVAVV